MNKSWVNFLTVFIAVSLPLITAVVLYLGWLLCVATFQPEQEPQKFCIVDGYQLDIETQALIERESRALYREHKVFLFTVVVSGTDVGDFKKTYDVSNTAFGSTSDNLSRRLLTNLSQSYTPSVALLYLITNDGVYYGFNSTANCAPLGLRLTRQNAQQVYSLAVAPPRATQRAVHSQSDILREMFLESSRIVRQKVQRSSWRERHRFHWFFPVAIVLSQFSLSVLWGVAFLIRCFDNRRKSQWALLSDFTITMVAAWFSSHIILFFTGWTEALLGISLSAPILCGIFAGILASTYLFSRPYKSLNYRFSPILTITSFCSYAAVIFLGFLPDNDIAIIHNIVYLIFLHCIIISIFLASFITTLATAARWLIEKGAGEKSDAFFGSVQERADVIDRHLGLRVGKPPELPIGINACQTRFIKYLQESSWGYVYYVGVLVATWLIGERTRNYENGEGCWGTLLGAFLRTSAEGAPQHAFAHGLVFRRIVRRHKHRADGMHARGDMAAALSEVDKALKLCDQLVGRFPEVSATLLNLELRNLRAELLLRTGEPHMAETTLLQVLSERPNKAYEVEVATLIRLGKLHAELGDPQRATSYYQQATDALLILVQRFVRDDSVMDVLGIAVLLRRDNLSSKPADDAGVLVASTSLANFLERIDFTLTDAAYQGHLMAIRAAREQLDPVLAADFTSSSERLRELAMRAPLVKGSRCANRKAVLLERLNEPLDDWRSVRPEPLPSDQYPPAIRTYIDDGERCRKSGSQAEALSFYEAAVATCPADARIVTHLAHCHLRMCHWGDAVRLYRRALDLSPHHLPALRGMVMALWNHRDQISRGHELHRAVAHAYSEIEAEIDGPWTVPDLLALAINAKCLGEHDAAESYLLCAMEQAPHSIELRICLAQFFDSNAKQAAALPIRKGVLRDYPLERGTLRHLREHGDVSIGELLDAAAKSRTNPLDLVYRNIAEICREAGLLAFGPKEVEAAYARKSLLSVLLTTRKTRADDGSSLSDFFFIIFLLTRHREKIARDPFHRIDEEHGFAWIMKHEADRISRSHPIEAGHLLASALADFRELGRWGGVCSVYQSYAKIALLEDEAAVARDTAAASIDLALSTGQTDQLIEGHILAGRAETQSGRSAVATGHFDKAIDMVELTRGRLVNPDSRARFLGTRASVYEAQVEALLDQGDAVRALEYVERAKARALVDLLGSHHVRIRDSADQTLIAEDERLQRRVLELERVKFGATGQGIDLAGTARGAWGGVQGLRSSLAALAEAASDENIARIDEELAACRRRLAAIKQHIRETSAEWATLCTVPHFAFEDPARPDDLSRLLTREFGPPTTGEKIAALSYFVVEDRTFIFAVPCWQGTASLHAAQSAAGAERIRELITEAYEDGGMKQGRALATFSKLYDVLIAPVRATIQDWGATALLFCPHDILHSVPMHALCRRDNDQLVYLAEEFACFYAPSLSTLPYISGKRVGVKPVVQASPNIRSETERTQTIVVGDPVTYLPRLGNAEAEAREIARLLPSARLFLREDATKANVIAGLHNADIIHLACHGEFDNQDALQSRLLLADGALHVDEILDLEIRARLVVLAACGSGISHIRAGDELVGMTRAWLYAGTPSVIASLWNADDEAASLLMQSFYQNWTVNGRSKLRALQAAQIEVLEVYGPNSVSRWAPFILVGDPV